MRSNRIPRIVVFLGNRYMRFYIASELDMGSPSVNPRTGPKKVL